MYTLSSALETAQAIFDRLSPHCERIDIAGSIRRRCSQVKDIEIVCQPKKQLKVDSTSLFPEESWETCDEFKLVIDSLSAAIEKGNANGRYMRIILKNGMPMDLFMPNYSDYYRQLTIRTGNAEYVQKIIAAQWRIKGWCGTDRGLRLISECAAKTGSDNKVTWKCTTEHPKLPPVWESEPQFFYWLGLPFTPPECRHLNNYMNYSR